MKPITVIPKEKERIYFTFSKDTIRVKAPQKWLDLYEYTLIDFTRKIESLVYTNYSNTLRGHISDSHKDFKNCRIKFTFKKGHKSKDIWDRTIIIKEGIIKIIEANMWDNKNTVIRYFYRLYKGEN